MPCDISFRFVQLRHTVNNMNLNNNSGAKARSDISANRGSDQRARDLRSEKDKTLMVVLLAIVSALVFMAAALAVFVLLYKPSVGSGDSNKTPSSPNPAVETSELDGVEAPVILNDDGSALAGGRKDDYYTFLVLGRDIVGLNTDIIMFVSFDAANGEISIMQIPRDTYIEIKGYSRKINSVYQYMHGVAYNNGKADVDRAAMEDTVAVFEANLGVTIDYYALVNLAGFGNIIDIIGGVPIDVPYDMNYSDPDQDLYINIKAGQQVLNGETAQQFIRYREGYVQGDIGRIDAQKLFMTALIEQVKNNINVSTLVGMINQMYTNVTTSLSVADLTYFAKTFFTIDDTSINFITFPGSDVTYTYSYYIMQRADMLALLNRYFNVYKTDISDAAFDPYEIFTNSKSSEITKIYQKSPTANLLEFVTTAGSIDDEGLYIPLN